MLRPPISTIIDGTIVDVEISTARGAVTNAKVVDEFRFRSNLAFRIAARAAIQSV